MIFVPEQELKRVPAWCKGHNRFCLPGAEVKVVKVVGDRVVKRR
jgi:hypothetical protein